MSEVTSTEDVDAWLLGGGFLVSRPLADRLELVTAVHFDTESADVESVGQPGLTGDSSLTAAATGVAYRGAIDVDASVGVAVPLGVDASPWPEGKLSVEMSLLDERLTPRVIAGTKGRLPTLRERFEFGVGNEDLGPEQALYGELGAKLALPEKLEVDVAGYVRRVNGLIRVDLDTGKLSNLGEVTMLGVDARVTVFPLQNFSFGADVSLLDLESEQGEDPIDRLPGRRGDVWATVARGDLGGTARVRYIGEMVDQRITLDDYALVSLSGYWYATHAMMVTLRVDNLLGTRYLDRAGGFLGEGRAIMVGLQGHLE